MTKLRSIILSLILSVAAINHATAEIKMNPLFTDNMVMQQKSNAPVWGKAEPGAKVKVHIRSRRKW